MSNVGRKYVSAIYESFEVADVMTKSTDITTYAVNDVVSQSTVAANSSALTFSNVGTHYGQKVILDEVTIVDNYYSTVLLPAFNLWLLKTKPAGIADNAPLDLSDANSRDVAAVVHLTDVYHASTNNTRFEAVNLQRHITLSTDTMDLYGLIEITSTYVPQISERFDITIKGLRM